MDISKILIIIGGIFILFGALLSGLLGPIGRLPGDILIERENTTVYIPIATMLLLSVVISLILWIMRR